MGWDQGSGLGARGQGGLVPVSELLPRQGGGAGVGLEGRTEQRLEQSTWGDTPGSWEGFSN